MGSFYGEKIISLIVLKIGRQNDMVDMLCVMKMVVGRMSMEEGSFLSQEADSTRSWSCFINTLYKESQKSHIRAILVPFESLT